MRTSPLAGPNTSGSSPVSRGPAGSDGWATSRGFYLQVPEGALSSVLVDDQERQQSSSVPFGRVHPEVKAGFEARLAELLPSSLFELVQRCGNSSAQAGYSVAARSYVRDRVCLVGDAGAVFPPFAGSGVLRAVANATSLADALAGAPTVDDGLRRWDKAQVQVAAQVMLAAERIERSAVFDMPDLSTMPTAATNDLMSATHPGLVVTLPGV
jgi:2-polyprenyl-6-methoxyphenol hydroxylase-like FAD-dependent oxidoreductase